MQLKKRLMSSGLISAATLILSFFIPIIPCRIAPNVPNPIYKWTLCSLDPGKVNTLGSITEYLGYTALLRDSYILTVIISFIIAMTFFHFFARKKYKN